MKSSKLLLTLGLAIAGLTVSNAVAKNSEAGRVVYANDFEKAAGPEWSESKIDTTPNGNRRFLGQFGTETVTLTLDDLPAHSRVTVSFDLFIIS